MDTAENESRKRVLDEVVSPSDKAADLGVVEKKLKPDSEEIPDADMPLNSAPETEPKFAAQHDNVDVKNGHPAQPDSTSESKDESTEARPAPIIHATKEENGESRVQEVVDQSTEVADKQKEGSSELPTIDLIENEPISHELATSTENDPAKNSDLQGEMEIELNGVASNPFKEDAKDAVMTDAIAPSTIESETLDHADIKEETVLIPQEPQEPQVPQVPQESQEPEVKNETPNDVKTLDKIKPSDSDIVVVPPVKPQLFYSVLKTGLVYDVRMRYHAKIFTSYFEYIDPHPEDPRRIYRIYKKLAEAGIIQDSSLSGSEDIGPLMIKIPIREATAEEILEVHSESHLEYILLTEMMSREQLLEETEKGDSIYVNNNSFESAKLSCGGTIEACRAVVEGKVKNSLAIVRPPGHHAEPETPGGFCLFSNVAVAAKNILKSYPESVRKIVIVDWDIHHGNGTQKSFYDDPRVLYISLHRYENGKFYPGTKYGNSTQVGEGAGEGFNMNIPWRSQGMHDGDYIYAFNKLILPVIAEFDPDLTIISSGFDAADGDIIGGCHVTPAGYGMMTHMLKGIAKGKVAVILEGGYNLDSISKSALGVAKVLVGEPPEQTIVKQPHLETIEVVDEVIKIQAKYWKCLRHGIPTKSFDDIYDLPFDSKAFKITSISEPIRAQQYHELATEHQFVLVPIISNLGANEKTHSFTTELPANLEDIVVASANIHEATLIVVTIHDPPDIWANLNPINGVIEGSSSIVLSHPLLQIIKRVKSEVGVEGGNTENVGYININIPLFQLPVPAGASSFLIFHNLEKNGATNGAYNPTIFAQELLLYIWDNYLSYFSNLKKLVFIGFGDSYQSIVHLYGKRPSQEIKDLVKGTVVFLNRSNLKSLVPVMDESMVDWYYQNSVIFTSCLNPCWVGAGHSKSNGNGNGSETSGNDETKKPRRKFGRVMKASVDGLYDVINEKFEEGIDFVLDSIEDYLGSSN